MTGKVLITGGAGFIGSHLARSLLAAGAKVGILDNFDDFYSPQTKRQNIKDLAAEVFVADIRDAAELQKVADRGWDSIVHLAALAGVRPSIANPRAYIDTNVTGTLNVLEAARGAGIGQVVFGSSSSVYGASGKGPFKESSPLPATLSPYAATKVAAEQLCSVYSHLHAIRCVVLRFFTVYGPGQRPDLAISKFTRAMLEGREIPFHGDGSSQRDYTHVSDIVAGISAALDYRKTPYEVFNLGSGRRITLAKLVGTLERITGKAAILERLSAQAADMVETWADITKASNTLGYRCKTRLSAGLRAFVQLSAA
ncbi:MAG: SDR family NAD(P)-dependent oxidoreductase [Chthoniobacterales bacterium]|nr:SDR family NAD(P)-dependent oxidoreductase [Chthoniobacterales bacterium]